ncbi:MAG: family 20 glycosylhydrolase [Parabacteroides sp.]|nr:family 20 glycosylhydrolase [Parabacteroides sp.]
MKKYVIYCLLFSFVSCQMQIEEKEYNRGIHIIPQPLQLEVGVGTFDINASTTIVLEDNIWEDEAGWLKDKLECVGCCKLSFADRPAENSILFKTNENLEKEGYEIVVDEKRVSLSAATEAGMFYAIQTLLQLLPAEIESPVPVPFGLSVPVVRIVDHPRFRYRGLMIDVCRHFFSVEELKKQISVMAMLKLNYLHLHLTDNQGWRIAIDKYPQLVECSAIQETYNGEMYGPYYYTKEDIKELVEYASRHHIEVIPEIEFPGHSLSALIPFPELSCMGGPFKSEQVFGVEENVFCVGNDSVFVLMENILKEVAELFPSRYLHIGGDECVKRYWKTCPRCQALAKRLGLKPTGEHSVEEQLQSYAIKRMERFVSDTLGKRMLGWEEILEGGLPEDATVMSWKGTESGAKAAAMGHDVIMASMADGLYLCAAQGADEVEPAAMGGQSYLKDVYEFEPVSEGLSDEHKHYVVGAQACLWSEWTSSVDLLEYMLYPRAVALAETAWSLPENKDWVDFQRRLENMQARLDLRGVNYHIPMPEGELTTNKVFTADSVVLEFTNSRSLPMVYTVDGTDPDADSPCLPERLVLQSSCVLKVCTKAGSGKLSPVRLVNVEKQTAVPALQGGCSGQIHLKLASGLFKNEEDYAKARFEKDTVIRSFSCYNRDKFDFKTPGLAVYTGEFQVPETGVYTFRSNADELWIAGSRLIYNPTSSRFYEKKTQIALEKGIHPFKLVFSNRLKEGFASCWYPIDFQYLLPSGGEWVKK